MSSSLWSCPELLRPLTRQACSGRAESLGVINRNAPDHADHQRARLLSGPGEIVVRFALMMLGTRASQSVWRNTPGTVWEQAFHDLNNASSLDCG
jgi:hypothetical protein